MRKQIFLLALFSFSFGQSDMTVEQIIQAIDLNLYAKSRVLTSKMVVHGRRTSRTIESKNWVIGNDKHLLNIYHRRGKLAQKCSNLKTNSGPILPKQIV